MTSAQKAYSLDPVTFEVLRNAFVTIADEMGEQILKTCHSFVLYNRDFSSAICDATGNTVAQGNFDMASHVGTLHLTAKHIMRAYGHSIAPGDVFVTNDPYIGGTHFNDVRLLRPVFADGVLIAIVQSNGHWADVGGKVPGSFDFTAREHFGEGLRITPVKVWDRDVYQDQVANLIVSNVRNPEDAEGDLLAQSEATRLGESELLRLVEKYGRETVVTALAEVQDHAERVARARIRDLPDGEWETEDFIDRDPDGGDGLIPVRVKMTIRGDTVDYDLSRSHPCVGSITNAGFGGGFSGVIGGMKLFFPEIPLNSGFYRTVNVELGHDTIVNASWPTAVTGFAMVYEKIMNAVIELWSEVMPERGMACSYNIEYLEIGGRDDRIRTDPGVESPYFMWYDWFVGGWGGRSDRDGANALGSIFGVGLQSQPVEGQERLCPVRMTEYEMTLDSGGPGEYRGGVGVVKGGVLTEASSVVASYLCDRERSVVWGIRGGLPSGPVGAWLERDGETTYLGAAWAELSLKQGDRLWRPSSGGGGHGDPLQRRPEAVLDDVFDGFVSVTRAARDYGVVLRESGQGDRPWEVDAAATRRERSRISHARVGWLEDDPERLADRYRRGEVDAYDLVRQYGVIVDWGTGELLEESTRTFRSMLQRRTVPHWVPIDV